VTFGGLTSGSALSAGALGASSIAPANDAMGLDYNLEVNNNHDDNASYAGNDNEDPEGADAPPEEDADVCKACLLCIIVQTNMDCGPGELVRLPEASAEALAVFDDIELQAAMLFASRLVLQAGGFSKEDPPIFACFLRWNLTARFLWWNCNEWTGCGHCLYIQKSPCKDVSVLTPAGPYLVAK
jgi:hypothetical protein